MNEWQPIETAPKDGTVIDLWSASFGRISDEFWMDGWVVEDITHWMPLPEPPK